MARTSTARTDIDFDRPGKQIGFVDIPHSPHDDAWGATRIPIAVISNGSGTTVILQGGNHGDEYEGPITLGELVRELDPAMVQGRIIVLPAVNAPAVQAGQRTSPVDGLNLNRTFPGDPLGSITQQISAYVSDVSCRWATPMSTCIPAARRSNLAERHHRTGCRSELRSAQYRGRTGV